MSSKKLYMVALRGMKGCGSGVVYGKSYVVAGDAGEAYQKVKKFLDDKDLGFCKERELESVTLLAESVEYPNCQTILFI